MQQQIQNYKNMNIINKLERVGFQQENSYSTPDGEVKELRHRITHGFVIYVDFNGHIYANANIYDDHYEQIQRQELTDIHDTLRTLGF